MKIKKALRLYIYAAVLLGALSIMLSEELDFLFPALFLTGVLFSIPYPLLLSNKNIRFFSTGFILILFGYLFLKTIHTGGASWLVNSTSFVLILTGIKLFRQERTADMYQLLALSFLEIVLGAVLYGALWYVFILLAYIIIFSLALIMLHLEKNGQGTVPFGNRFYYVTSLLALLLFFLSFGFFFFIPRIGLGFFLTHGRKSQLVTGFSDSVRLDDFGKIKKDKTVAMRVKFKTKRQKTKPIRLRGLSFDYYNGVSWSRSVRLSKKIRLKFFENQGYVLYTLMNKKYIKTEKKIKYTVYLEPGVGSHRVIFTIPNAISIKPVFSKIAFIRKGVIKLFQDYSLDLFFKMRDQVGLKYDAESYIYTINDKIGESKYNTTFYTTLPPKFNVKIRQLSKKITFGKKGVNEKAKAVRDFLIKNYSYSLSQPHNPIDPISDFLFTHKAGHCEYFATAMALMLRSINIPARVVNGFYGGEYNSIGDYYVITNGNAHSWVEYFIPKASAWVTIDPTPAESFSAQFTQQPGRIALFMDYLEYKWYQWVIEYNLEKQLKLLGSVSKSFKTDYSIKGFKKFIKNMKQLASKAILSLIAIVLLIIIIKRLRNNQNTVHYNKTQKVLLKIKNKAISAGMETKNIGTAHELFNELRRYTNDFKSINDFERLYLELRFSNKIIKPNDMKQLKRFASLIIGKIKQINKHS